MKHKTIPKSKKRNVISEAHSKRGSAGSGPHKNRNLDIKKGLIRRQKHKGQND